MSSMQYVGARYVPIVYTNPDDGSANWKADVTYEALTVVTYNGDSYTSKKAVPNLVGNPADNSDYWVKTGDFNASLLALQNRVTHAEEDIDALETQNGNETLETEAQNLSGAVNELLGTIKTAYVTPEMFGAIGDGVTDDSTAINDCLQNGGESIVFKSDATYYCEHTIVINKKLKIVGNGATIKTSALIGVEVGNYDTPITVILQDLTVDRDTYSGESENIGFLFKSCYDSSFVNLVSNNSKYNFYLTSENTKGFAYNYLENIEGSRGYINLIIDADTNTGGYVNENVFVGGRFFTSSDTIKNIVIANGDNNRFYAPSCEGAGVCAIECGGTHNVFEYPRTEGTWSSGYGFIFSDSSESCRLLGLRYDLHLQDNGISNTYWTQYDGLKCLSSRTDGNVATFTRTAGSSAVNPIVEIKDAGSSGNAILLKITPKNNYYLQKAFQIFANNNVVAEIDARGSAELYRLDITHDANSLASSPFSIGSAKFFKNGANFYWSYDGTDANVIPLGHEYRTFAGDPTNVVTPRYVTEIIINSTNDDAYLAVGDASSDWKKIT